MPLFSIATLTFPAHGGDDRLAVRQFDDRVVLVVADGAGGRRGGADAAQFACERIMSQAADSFGSARDWADRLKIIDRQLTDSDHGGQTALLVAEVWNGRVCGASVGDSEAWAVDRRRDPIDLTDGQPRRPLVGTGAARPKPFGPVELDGRRLLLASDGLFRFATKKSLLHKAQWTVVSRAPSLLTDLVRLRNGELQDDVAVIVCQEAVDRAAVRREIARLLPKARQGDGDSGLELAQCYERLDDEEAATHWFKAAADAGSPEACCDIGWRYAHGRSVPLDYLLANHYYRLGAQRGAAMAINNLGFHHERGDRGVPQDLQYALDCYQRAAELGCSKGQINLGQAYLHGKFGLPKDATRAANLFRAAARQGDGGAMILWGDCLERGLGVPANPGKAMEQFRWATVAGQAEGMWRCGRLYDIGLGVEQDARQALRWYAEGAQHGCVQAQRCLGKMYLDGRGTARDRRLAVLWLTRAAHAGDEEAQGILAAVPCHAKPGAHTA